MSSNPHNMTLTNLYAKLAKKVVNSSYNINSSTKTNTNLNNNNTNNINLKDASSYNKAIENINNPNRKIQINRINIKSKKFAINSNHNLDSFLSLSNPNISLINNQDNQPKNNDTNKTFENSNKNKFPYKKEAKREEKYFKDSSHSNLFLNKKRKYMTKEEEKEFIEEMKASEEIDKMLVEIREKNRAKLLEKQKEKEKRLEEKRKKKKEKKNLPIKDKFLEALGLTEEDMIKNSEENKEKEIFNKKDSLNDLSFNKHINNFDPNNHNSILFKKKCQKYLNYNPKFEDIYLNVLSFSFYHSEQKIEIIPDYFDNELHYKYIWIPNFFNELKYCLLNEKAEKSDIQNYKDIDIKIKLTYLQDYKSIPLLKITPNKSLNEFKTKILKDKDIIAIYPEKEEIKFEDITISNNNKLNYFLGVVVRDIDSYEIKILIHSKDVDKFKLNYNNNPSSKKEDTFNIKYLNNINSSLREFKALFSLELSNFKDILNPRLLLNNKNNINSSNNSSKEIKNKNNSNISNFLDKIKSSNIYNSSQIEAIEKANQMKENEVLLIQGPPGTGKTHTILGLTSLFMLKKNVKILICTQSNTAIDEICQRLINKGLYDEKLNKIDSNFIRFGYSERKDKEKKYLDTKKGKLLEKKSLEYLVNLKYKNILEESNQKKEDIIKKINTLSVDKEKNKNQIKTLENERQLILKTLNDDRLRKQNYENILLLNSPILCTTLNNSGNEKFKKINIKFDYLIIDEACQCVEPSCLIPLSYEIKYLILVGDHKQLPATVFYQNANSILYNRSLFERLIDNHIPINMLTIQYRMQTNIRKFISSTFYDNKLIDSTDNEYIKKINNEVFYQAIDINKNFSFFDLKFSEENYDGKIKSYYNEDEINFTNEFILKINNSLKKVGNNTNEKKYNYAIITPYQAQVKRFKEKFKINNIEIAINTVDSFQGQERDIVLFSTVRSSKKNNSINDNQSGGESIGFLKDFRRMNVALSRAKLGCFIIGNSQKLISNSYWEKLINFCKMKKCFYMIDSPKEFNQKIENIFLSKV